MEAKRFYKTNLLFTSLLWRVRPSSGRKYFMQVPQLFNGETLQAGFRKSGIVYSRITLPGVGFRRSR